MDADDEPRATRPGSLRSTMYDPSHRADDSDGTASEAPTSDRAGDRRRARTAVLALVALVVAAPLATVLLAGGASSLAGTGPTGLAAAQSGPTLSLTNVSASVGGTATTRLALSEAPDGLAGVQVSVVVANGSVGTIEGASYPDHFSLTEDPAVSDDGTEVTLSAADAEGSVEPGATNVTLARVDVRGEAAGETTLSIRVDELSEEDGSPIRPATGNATLSVAPGDGSGGSDGDGGVTTGLGPTGLPLALAVLALAGLLARLRR